MINELKKSINATLYERVSSPLYGTLFISWVLWNWKIIYLTFFVSEKKLDSTKIEYILNNYYSFEYTFVYPSISTLLLITIVPFISNGAYWLHIKFQKWKQDKKYEIEKTQLLSIEQSIEIREDISNKEKAFEEMLSDKNDQIKRLDIELNETKEKYFQIKEEYNSSEKTNYNNNETKDEPLELAHKIEQNNKLIYALEEISEYIQKDIQLPGKIDTNELAFFESNNIISRISENGIYEFTDFGKSVNKTILNRKF